MHVLAETSQYPDCIRRLLFDEVDQSITVNEKNATRRNGCRVQAGRRRQEVRRQSEKFPTTRRVREDRARTLSLQPEFYLAGFNKVGAVARIVFAQKTLPSQGQDSNAPLPKNTLEPLRHLTLYWRDSLELHGNYQ